MRLDLVRATVETIYITIWASNSVSLHLGKTENAEEILKGHSGLRLQVSVKLVFLHISSFLHHQKCDRNLFLFSYIATDRREESG